jgi:hypothetical protein
MATVPVTRLWTTGEIVTAAMMNDNVTDVLNFLLQPPLCEVEQSVAQSIGNNSFTALTFTTEIVDNSGMHSTSSNTERITAVYPGWYLFGGAYAAGNNVTGARGTQYWGGAGSAQITGSRTDFSAAPATVTTVVPARTKNVYLGVGQFLTLEGRQVSGGSLSTIVTGTERSSFWARFSSN